MPSSIINISAAHWFNTDRPLEPADLAGKIVVVHAFQMLCPGCVSHGTPQAERLHRLLRQRPDVVVIGLHSVFEHHEAMGPVALKAFIHEYRLTLPIAVDAPGVGVPIPQTMQRYALRGTPSILIFDRDGALARHGFGQEYDLTIGLIVGALLSASDAPARPAESRPGSAGETGACPLPTPGVGPVQSSR